jgi:hypothetical protein
MVKGFGIGVLVAGMNIVAGYILFRKFFPFPKLYGFPLVARLGIFFGFFLLDCYALGHSRKWLENVGFFPADGTDSKIYYGLTVLSLVFVVAFYLVIPGVRHRLGAKGKAKGP